MLKLMSLWCPVRTCWRNHKHKGKTISQLASTNAYVNDVVNKHKHKKKARVYAYACVTIEDRA